jgi:hypothetical protein
MDKDDLALKIMIKRNGFDGLSRIRLSGCEIWPPKQGERTTKGKENIKKATEVLICGPLPTH